MLGRIIKKQERRHAGRDTNRLVREFAWGAEFIREHVNGDDPRHLFREFAREAVANSDRFFSAPPVTDYQREGEHLTWSSAVHTSSPENNVVRARYFPAEMRSGQPRKCVLILPHWNADPESYVSLCRLFNRFGISALRLTLPYHEARKPPELERSDHLVSPIIGRTLQSMRQAVLDTRAAVDWLKNHEGYDRIGLLGTSIGSCTGFLAAAHDERIDVGVFNHVSGSFADVVWHGISTQHVKQGIDQDVSLEELRDYWAPISPLSYIERVAQMAPRPMRFIAAKYDLTFPADLSREVIAAAQRHFKVDVTWLPCGHYTSGEKPWVYLVGWKIVNFLRKNL